MVIIPYLLDYFIVITITKKQSNINTEYKEQRIPKSHLLMSQLHKKFNMKVMREN